MYFWDSLSNAQKWQESKRRRSPSYATAIVETGVYSDAMLELTNAADQAKVARFHKEMWSLFHDPAKPNQKHHLGALLDSLYDCDPAIWALPAIKAKEDPGTTAAARSAADCLAVDVAQAAPPCFRLASPVLREREKRHQHELCRFAKKGNVHV